MDEKITKEITKNGTIVYRNERNQIHNINDEPAIIWEYGRKNGLKMERCIEQKDRPYYFQRAMNIGIMKEFI